MATDPRRAEQSAEQMGLRDAETPGEQSLDDLGNLPSEFAEAASRPGFAGFPAQLAATPCGDAPPFHTARERVSVVIV